MFAQAKPYQLKSPEIIGKKSINRHIRAFEGTYLFKMDKNKPSDKQERIGSTRCIISPTRFYGGEY